MWGSFISKANYLGEVRRRRGGGGEQREGIFRSF